MVSGTHWGQGPVTGGEEPSLTKYAKKKAMTQQPPQMKKTLEPRPAAPGVVSTRYGVAYPMAKLKSHCVEVERAMLFVRMAYGGSSLVMTQARVAQVVAKKAMKMQTNWCEQENLTEGTSASRVLDSE